ncbi:hypothetical protein ACFL6K_07080 [Candidatus Latescibacterota bacterium]
MTGDRTFRELRDRFMETLISEAVSSEVRTFSSPELYSQSRVSYIIPPVTDIEQRGDWSPGNIYVVKDGTVAIGRVGYTRTSGEFLVEELILRKGDIFGEFEVPLSILANTDLGVDKLPPRFNMTYGAWASGPSLNWSMAYPREIQRDSIIPESAKVAVHPFYIKSKNLRPETNANVIVIPVDEFESIISENTGAMTWFLMNVLRKTRLYFESPSQGYGRSSIDIVSRFIIRILAYRIRHGIVVTEKNGRKTTCRTFIGPTEWLKYVFGAYMMDLKTVIHSAGESTRDPLPLPLFSDELENLIDVTIHYPVKDIDDTMLVAMGCSPEEDRRENRYGLLSGIHIILHDLEAFNNYLLEKGE